MLSFVCHDFRNCWTSRRPLVNFNKRRSQVVSSNPLRKLISMPNQCSTWATDLEIQIGVMEWLAIVETRERKCQASLPRFHWLILEFVSPSKSLLEFVCLRFADSTILQDAGKVWKLRCQKGCRINCKHFYSQFFGVCLVFVVRLVDYSPPRIYGLMVKWRIQWLKSTLFSSNHNQEWDKELVNRNAQDCLLKY